MGLSKEAQRNSRAKAIKEDPIIQSQTVETSVFRCSYLTRYCREDYWAKRSEGVKKGAVRTGSII